MERKKIVVNMTVDQLEDLMLLESLYRELSYVKYERLCLNNFSYLKLEVKERLRKIYGVES